MTDPSDIFSRTRDLVGELSAAILGAGTRSMGVERARTEGNLSLMERNCTEMGKLLSQALAMQMALAKQLAKEPRIEVVDMRNMRVGIK